MSVTDALRLARTGQMPVTALSQASVDAIVKQVVASTPAVAGALPLGKAAGWMGMSVETFNRDVRPYVKCLYCGDLRVWAISELQRHLDKRATRGR